jgi:putative ABC transport system substrate-binding protein
VPMRVIGLAVVLVLSLLAPSAGEAQQGTKVARIGLLGMGSVGSSPRVEIFRQGLRERGYVEGQNVVIEDRSAVDLYPRLPMVAAELVALKVDVLVAFGEAATEAARKATDTIPIVMFVGADPVETGIAVSLSRPGGNVTGVSLLVLELIGKRLELLKEALPTIRRVARRSEDLEKAFANMTEQHAEALITVASTMLGAHRTRVVELARKHRLPGMFHNRMFVEGGGLLSYAPNSPDIYRKIVVYVDRILKGAKPADLPIEQPTKFELVTIPQSILLRADQVLE